MPVKIKPATGAGSVSLEAQNAISTDYTLTLPGATGTVALTASPVFTTNITVPAVIGGTTASSSLTLQSTSGVGTTDSILFKVGNNGATTAAAITSAGNIGFGTTSPDIKFVVGSTSYAGADVGQLAQFNNPNIAQTSGGAMVSIGSTSTAAADRGGLLGFTALTGQAVSPYMVARISGRLVSTSDYSGYIAFETTSNVGAYTERMRILGSGNILSLAGGSTTATGTGIAFPATQSASSDVNTLDDYEEGEWTPRVMVNLSSTGITYSGRAGRYTKIGNIVQISYGISLSNKGSGSGDVNITDLPFVPYNPSDARNLGTIGFEGLLSSFPTSCMWGLAYDNGIIYSRYQTATGQNDLTSANITNTTVFYGTFVYRVA